jgi:hypothetical protein
MTTRSFFHSRLFLVTPECSVLASFFQVYPERLVASPWNITDPDRCKYQCGFSGTNDTVQLLPSVMHQVPHSSKALGATNGKMLDHLLTKSTFLCLPRASSLASKKLGWECLLQFAVDQEVDAVIDVGALLAGQPIRCVAQELTKLQRRPVVFFDSSAKPPGWVLLNALGLQWPLASSPFPERDAFVLFDQARCRGADLKLRPDAVAIVTLSPDLCKDALIQVCLSLCKCQTLWPSTTMRLKGTDHHDCASTFLCHGRLLVA